MMAINHLSSGLSIELSGIWQCRSAWVWNRPTGRREAPWTVHDTRYTRSAKRGLRRSIGTDCAEFSPQSHDLTKVSIAWTRIVRTELFQVPFNEVAYCPVIAALPKSIAGREWHRFAHCLSFSPACWFRAGCSARLRIEIRPTRRISSMMV